MADALPAAAIAALQEGRKIDAIRIVREERNLELKEAKDAVDAYVRSQPALQASLQSRQTQAMRGLLNWIAGIALALIVLYFIVTRTTG